MRNLKLPPDSVEIPLLLPACVCAFVRLCHGSGLIQMIVNKNTALVLRPHSASCLKGRGLCGAAQISLTLCMCM